MTRPIEQLYDRIGYRFRDGKLLEQALTHPSCSAGSDYQRLEFLGDAVLELAVSEYLYRARPDMREGELTRARAYLVREETLSLAAENAGLSGFIRMGHGESKGGGARKASILCDVFESVLAAVYLDGGKARADAFAERFLSPFLEREDLAHVKDPKSLLQELLQKDGRAPEYVQTGREGPDHDPRFTYAVLCGGEKLGEGTGTSKQEAQQKAASAALGQITAGKAET